MLKSYFSPKVDVRTKPAAYGPGLFARSFISAGEMIFAKGGHLVTTAEAKEIESQVGEYCLQIYPNLHLCPKDKGEADAVASYMYHSCDPNVGVDGQMTFVAIRDISPDEELCYDYAMTTDRDFRMTCSCGANVCRGVITGEDWRREDLQRRYGRYFSYYILQKISRADIA